MSSILSIKSMSSSSVGKCIAAAEKEKKKTFCKKSEIQKNYRFREENDNCVFFSIFYVVCILVIRYINVI